MKSFFLPTLVLSAYTNVVENPKLNVTGEVLVRGKPVQDGTVKLTLTLESLDEHVSETMILPLVNGEFKMPDLGDTKANVCGCGSGNAAGNKSHSGGGSAMSELPILDVSWCNTYRLQPNDPFTSLDQQTDEEDFLLQETLGIPGLIQEQSQENGIRGLECKN